MICLILLLENKRTCVQTLEAFVDCEIKLTSHELSKPLPWTETDRKCICSKKLSNAKSKTAERKFSRNKQSATEVQFLLKPDKKMRPMRVQNFKV